MPISMNSLSIWEKKVHEQKVSKGLKFCLLLKSPLHYCAKLNYNLFINLLPISQVIGPTNFKTIYRMKQQNQQHQSWERKVWFRTFRNCIDLMSESQPRKRCHLPPPLKCTFRSTLNSRSALECVFIFKLFVYLSPRIICGNHKLSDWFWDFNRMGN